MRVSPKPGDSLEEIALMSEIDTEWKNFIRLRKEMEAAATREGLLRAKLRLLHEGLAEGEVLTLNTSEHQKVNGKLEISSDTPYLWLRTLDKSGNPSKRRLKLDEGARVARPDGSAPVPLHPK